MDGASEHEPTIISMGGDNAASSQNTEDDLNYDRRKRRKTASPDTHALHHGQDQRDNQIYVSLEAPPWRRQLADAAAMSSSIQDIALRPNSRGGETQRTGSGPENSPPSTPSVIADTPPASQTPRSSQKKLDSRTAPIQSAHPTRPSPSTAQSAYLSDQAVKSLTPKKKVLKLNSNGKLLSSPTGTGSPKNRKAKATYAKGKAEARKTGVSTIVKIPYGIDFDSKSVIGAKIEGVISASQDHKDTVLVVAPPTPAGPPKPTHPFFLGKANLGAVADLQLNTDSATTQSGNTLVSDYDATVSPQKRIFSSSDKFRPRQPTSASISFSANQKPVFGKLSDQVNPIWPPRGFEHIRDIDNQDTDMGLADDALSATSQSVPVKAKEVTANVSADEDVLSRMAARLHPASNGSQGNENGTDSSILRKPTRRLLSGRVLQNLAESKCRLQEPTSVEKPQHPAVTRLLHALPTSLSAFDQAKCEPHSWTAKFLPQRSDDVLQIGREPRLLRDWLKSLVVSAVDTGSNQKPEKDRPRIKNASKQKKKRKRQEDLVDFIISSDEEAATLDPIEDSTDELAPDADPLQKKTVMRVTESASTSRFVSLAPPVTNAIIISGPHGCGKSASVFAVAKELGFEVFEINSGSRRNARDIMDKVGDMTQNHLVQCGQDVSAQTSQKWDAADAESVQRDIDSGEQGTLNSFLGARGKVGSKAKQSKSRQRDAQVNGQPADKYKAQQSQKQSLILIEEVDVLFEEDKQFWSGVLNLMSQSRRPIILTCNDESLVPLETLNLHAILRYSSPPIELATKYLVTLAATEGHSLSLDDVSSLYTSKNCDFRATIMDLDFWCQMGVGDQKGGLDWIIDQWPPGNVLDAEGQRLRVVSEGTYLGGIGWTARDILHDAMQLDLERCSELMLETLEAWNLSPIEWLEDDDHVDLQMREVSAPCQASGHCFNDICAYAEAAESRSAIDVLCRPLCASDGVTSIDTTVPEMSEKMRTNLLEGYPVLNADPCLEYTELSKKIGSTACVLVRLSVSGGYAHFEEDSIYHRINARSAKAASERAISRDDLLVAFEPIMDEKPTFPPASGRLAPSFDNPTSVLAEDLGPYIRFIVSFDQRLEEQRLQLSNVLVHGGKKGKTRTTRASRAALEGGSKANTRRERWFPKGTDFDRVLSTGGDHWQEAALRYGIGQAGRPTYDNEIELKYEEDQSSSNAFPGSSADSRL